uniref:Uncharacterized protein n=1 Tax=Vespula pensylvanica TaxID=30213 RepID=A0A834N4S4_VESPE|nr:hypothetical protein H0235_016918 [Vespula pensylvanica]
MIMTIIRWLEQRREPYNTVLCLGPIELINYEVINDVVFTIALTGSVRISQVNDSWIKKGNVAAVECSSLNALVNPQLSFVLSNPFSHPSDLA